MLVFERYVQTADSSDRWGVTDICRYHTEFCARNPNTEQYASASIILALCPACGINLPCKFKHHFMIPANPDLHCVHIGPMDIADHYMQPLNRLHSAAQRFNIINFRPFNP